MTFTFTFRPHTMSLSIFLHLMYVCQYLTTPHVMSVSILAPPVGDLFKRNLVDILHVQDGVQDGHCTFIPNITPSGSVLE